MQIRVRQVKNAGNWVVAVGKQYVVKKNAIRAAKRIRKLLDGSIKIQYINVRYSKYAYGMTPPLLLDKLIASHDIIQFYRESEKKWVVVGSDPIRGTGGTYIGPERRAS